MLRIVLIQNVDKFEEVDEKFMYDLTSPHVEKL